MRLVLYVPHRGEPKMVGKLFEVNGSHVFLHEAKPAQRHIKTNSPGGLDAVVLEWLEGLPFAVVIDFLCKEEDTIYRVFPHTMRQYGIQEISDGRNRFYLPGEFWGVLPSGSYAIPWITNRKTLEEPAWQATPAASRSTRTTSRRSTEPSSAPPSGARQPSLDLPPK